MQYFMNPKNISGLDPKLRETYERVMGTSLPQSQPAQAQPQPQAAPPPPQQPVLPQQPVQTQPVAPDPVSDAGIASPQLFTNTNPFQESVPPPAEVIAKNAVVGAEKKKSHLTAILVGVGGVIFFIAYGVIWAKVFGLF